jgi:hypothetical protein
MNLQFSHINHVGASILMKIKKIIKFLLVYKNNYDITVDLRIPDKNLNKYS